MYDYWSKTEHILLQLDVQPHLLFRIELYIKKSASTLKVTWKWWSFSTKFSSYMDVRFIQDFIHGNRIQYRKEAVRSKWCIMLTCRLSESTLEVNFHTWRSDGIQKISQKFVYRCKVTVQVDQILHINFYWWMFNCSLLCFPAACFQMLQRGCSIHLQVSHALEASHEHVIIAAWEPVHPHLIVDNVYHFILHFFHYCLSVGEYWFPPLAMIFQIVIGT